MVLTNAQNYQSYITFVVRDDTRKADFLYQQSVTTYQAYNNYPDDGKTGKSLYDFNSYGATVPAVGKPRATKASFDRPYADGLGSGQLAGFSGSWERYYIGWLEQSGYDVTYSTNVDTHTDGARLRSVKGFLSVGHDEYWSKEMVDAATSARDAGVHLGFFGSNTAYWQIRFEASAAGVANRVIVGYKDAKADPVKDSTATVLWRDPPANRPEQGLVGVQYTAHLKNEGAGAVYVVQNSAHWVWEGTGFADGSRVYGILGYETDRLMSEYPVPAILSYTILSRSPVVDTTGRKDYANSSIYQAPSGAWVFATGSNHWSYGLGRAGATDARIQRGDRQRSEPLSHRAGAAERSGPPPVRSLEFFDPAVVTGRPPRTSVRISSKIGGKGHVSDPGRRQQDTRQQRSSSVHPRSDGQGPLRIHLARSGNSSRPSGKHDGGADPPDIEYARHRRGPRGRGRRL